MASIIQLTFSEPRSSWVYPSIWLKGERRCSTVMSSSVWHSAFSSYQQASCQYMNGLTACAASSSHTPALLYQGLQKADSLVKFIYLEALLQDDTLPKALPIIYKQLLTDTNKVLLSCRSAWCIDFWQMDGDDWDDMWYTPFTRLSKRSSYTV